ncbi:hypothetical protein RIF29_01925 [Crotalaria pallida]|uniref:Uncharacterized protein n=1 Tax=Crotalaria pallida TaxID=3830 RepID=A0AAN9IXU4_CROPI
MGAMNTIDIDSYFSISFIEKQSLHLLSFNLSIALLISFSCRFLSSRKWKLRFHSSPFHFQFILSSSISFLFH